MTNEKIIISIKHKKDYRTRISDEIRSKIQGNKENYRFTRKFLKDGKIKTGGNEMAHHPVIKPGNQSSSSRTYITAVERIL
ncbi:hypothetical protein I79_003800 [Cricetulus griseus]|uniref:Uncharacterized protein n=1 Tax=Cricetulus griseus TaxID=10029 RepID=G3H0Y0_CRIGR|nr:hypothetical protein I79_003800 [Cricetulus griseus]